eukprot:10135581-Alexandrium_andersonii.AAC.1
MPKTTTVPQAKVPGDDEEMPDAAPADQGSVGLATAGPALADPVVAAVAPAEDEPMGDVKAGESASTPDGA